MKHKDSKEKAPEATSYKQLDFVWHPSLPKSKSQDWMGETVDFIIGHQSSAEIIKKDRLFVPLSKGPFEWFSSGQKKWELRKLGRQYTRKHVKVGREVELRRGYSGQEALWGEIVQVLEAQNVFELFDLVPYLEIIPTATSLEDAVNTTKEILKVDNNTPLIAFSVSQFK